ncbi:hypothetical protein [Synechococcus sp. M16CYN]|uniref:hypothetical protein n=1 Tax=Synechococcus sp. M16CYN TaxID=3103139 RepID=UPI00334003A7
MVTASSGLYSHREYSQLRFHYEINGVTETMVQLKIHHWIKTDCGRAKLAELQRRRGAGARFHLIWFILIASARDWSLPSPNRFP